jgi:hypothetical protein
LQLEPTEFADIFDMESKMALGCGLSN